jgi:GTP-binding protein
LLVDAQEGPMPQTKFVLKKSLELGLKPIVVINKIDKPAARPAEVNEMVYELFLYLGANDEQLDFPVVYAAAKQGFAKAKMEDESDNLEPLLDLVLSHVKPSSSPELSKNELLAQPFNLAYDNFLGRLAICRVYEGKIKAAQTLFIENLDGSIRTGKIAKLFTFKGIGREEVSEA